MNYISYKKVYYICIRKISSVYTISYVQCTQYVHKHVYRKSQNKSEEDIQRYKPDPYEYILNDM